MIRKALILSLAVAVVGLGPAAFLWAAETPVQPQTPPPAPILAPTPTPTPPPKPLEVGDVFPGDISMIWSFTGNEYISLEDKKLVALVFMNASCSACKAELRAISTEYGKISEKAIVYAVSEDFEPKEALPRYIQKYKFPFNYLIDRDFELARRFGFSYTPATVIIKDKKIVYKKSGYTPEDFEIILENLK